MKKRIERNRESMDATLALTSDLLKTAEQIAAVANWRVAGQAVLYVFQRITGGRGRKALSDFLRDDGVGWVD